MTTRLLALALLAAGCAGSRPVTSPPAQPIPDTALGLAPGSVFEAPAPPPMQPNESAPGDLPALPRPYQLAPARIPHGIDSFLPITLKENACVGCHAIAEKKEREPTPIPASHYVDIRNAPDRRGEKVAGARWDCLLCHVPRTDAQPLVENRFAP